MAATVGQVSVRRKMLMLSGSIVALCSLAPAQAAAQEKSAGAASTDESIVVTARVNNRVSVGKSDALLIETPQSVSVVDSTFIETIDTKTISESLGYTPGLITQSASFARAADNVYLRGFPVNTADGSILLDGLKPQSSTYGGGIEPYSLERLEVLRGATSVLYGQLGPGGVINAVSKRPSFTPSGEIRAQYGSFDRFELAADYTGPISGDIAFRLTGLVRDSNTDVEYIKDDKRFIAPALTWNISGDTQLTVLGSYQQIRMNFAAPLSIQLVTGEGLSNGPIPRDRFVGEPDFDHYDANQWNAGYRFSHRFSDAVSFEHALRYYEGELDWDYLQVGAVTADGWLSRTISSRREETTSLSTDTRLKIDLQTGAVKHELMAGLDIYVPTWRFDRFQNGSVAPLNIYDPVYGAVPVVNRSRNRGADIRSRQIGLYFQDQMKIGNNWTLVAGGRQDWSRNRVNIRATGIDTEQNDSAFTWRAGVVYVGDNGIAPYVSYSRSFTPQLGTDYDGNAFIPSEGEQYEAGIRYQKPSSKLLLSAAIFQLTQTNVLTPDVTPGRPSGYSVQNGEVRVRGIEAEAQAQILKDLNVLLAYAWFDPEITQSNTPGELGERPTFVPRQTLSLFADYRLASVGLPDVRIGAGTRYTGSSNIIGADFDNEGYMLADAFIEWNPGKWRVAFNARNIFDKKYTSCLSAGVNGCRYGDPQQFSVTLGYGF
ncbi:TonB-dependent siderophore receptor [Tsuneonella suprasediminis]|uniref:TonB-dependent siderophore receptor n=1 Tax=Tsuneonella suprasediminis TaxID=2306996 RepID=UPI002F955419